MKKPILYTEIAYLVGIVLLAVGNSLSAFADFGMSMVVAPAYVLHLALSDLWPWFSFGLAEYAIQALIILALIVVTRRVKARFFLSYCTTLLYGLVLDAVAAPIGLLPAWFGVRLAAFLLGFLLTAAGVALLLTPYFPPGLYEVFVQEITARWKWKFGVVKTVYDLCSLVVAVVMSLLVFGTLRGIGVATVVCAFLNGTAIHLFGRLFSRLFAVKDALPWRGFFEGKQ